MSDLDALPTEAELAEALDPSTSEARLAALWQAHHRGSTTRSHDPAYQPILRALANNPNLPERLWLEASLASPLWDSFTSNPALPFAILVQSDLHPRLDFLRANRDRAPKEAFAAWLRTTIAPTGRPPPDNLPKRMDLSKNVTRFLAWLHDHLDDPAALAAFTQTQVNQTLWNAIHSEERTMKEQRELIMELARALRPLGLPSHPLWALFGAD